MYPYLPLRKPPGLAPPQPLPFAPIKPIQHGPRGDVSGDPISFPWDRADSSLITEPEPRGNQAQRGGEGSEERERGLPLPADTGRVEEPATGDGTCCILVQRIMVTLFGVLWTEG